MRNITLFLNRESKGRTLNFNFSFFKKNQVITRENTFPNSYSRFKNRVIFFILFFFTPSLFAQNLDLVYKNNKGSRSFKNDKKMEAYEEFLGALSLDPYNPLVQFNLGSTLNGLGEEEKAEKLYLQLLKDVDAHLQKDLPANIQQQWLKVKFAILYNLGVHYQLTKKVDQALEYYQKGLELLPDSKEIKTNIEMMFDSGGGGKGESDQKQKDEKGEGKGESEGEDQKDKEEQKPSDGDRTNKKQKGKEFDQSQLSMEDLKRIMDELKQQEQGIRSKVQRKGDKSEPKEKQW